MPTTRRNLLRLGGVAAAGALMPAAIAATGDAGASAAPRKLRILILGGTGFTGPTQVRYALARGHEVTVFNRGRREIEWPGQVEELVGDRDVGNLESLEATGKREWDVCIDNPTTAPHWVADVGKVLKGRVKHFVFVSTVSVYAANSKSGADESEALLPWEHDTKALDVRIADVRADMSLYGPAKAESERQAAKWFGDRLTIIRPGLIVGPGDETDRFSYWPLRLRDGGEVLAPGTGRDPVQFIDARDLAEWTIRLAEARQLGTFNALGPDYPLDMAGMLYGIRASTTAGAQLNWVPWEFLSAQGVSPWADLPVFIPGEGDDSGFHRRSNAAAVAAGLKFRSIATTTADTFTWFDQQPAERRATRRAGLSAEREREVLAAWRASAGAAG
jgi:2'-hydroxyisoflavone reductase